MFIKLFIETLFKIYKAGVPERSNGIDSKSIGSVPTGVRILFPAWRLDSHPSISEKSQAQKILKEFSGTFKIINFEVFESYSLHKLLCSRSSVGLEHFRPKEGVTGSNPVEGV